MAFSQSDDEDERNGAGEPTLRDELLQNWEAWEKDPESAEPNFRIPEDKPRLNGAAKDGAETSSPSSPQPRQGEDARPSSPADQSRARDEQGRFAPKQEQPAAAAQQNTDGSKDPQQQGQTPAGESNTLAAPETFSEAGRQAWNTLHPEIRQHMQRTETQHQETLRQFAEPIRPLHEMSTRRGMGWQEGLKRLTAAQEFLDRDPAGALIWLAKSSNIDLDELADKAAALAQRGGAADPVSSLPAALAPFQQRVQQLESRITERESAEQKQRENAMLREVNTFAAKPENVHFSAVEQEIYALIPAIRQRKPGASVSDVLRDAYDAAVMANPETRAKVLQAQQQQEQERQREQQRLRTRNSRAAEILTDHRGSNGRMPDARPNGDLSLRQELEQNWGAWEEANH